MVDTRVAAQACDATNVQAPVFERFPARETTLGTLKILRALPIREKRLVGAWCFLDRFGPLSFSDAKPMDVAPHPHIGLQTMSWLLQGEIVHKDSLGSEALLGPGGVNVMTSGGGIAHSEETPSKNSGFLNGVQLWVALPDSDRHGSALWNFVARTPEEIANARSDWQSHQRFGDVTAYQGPRLTAPPLQRFASPNPVS